MDICVGNLPTDTTVGDLRKAFESFGQVETADVVRQEGESMKTRRTTDGTPARRTDTGARGIGASIVSLRTTKGETTKHRMGPEPGPSLHVVALSHDRIAERARAIWLARGCSPDHDHENWCDAEAQLRAELGIA